MMPPSTAKIKERNSVFIASGCGYVRCTVCDMEMSSSNMAIGSHSRSKGHKKALETKKAAEADNPSSM